ncbi:hypothetical protein [Leptolyngbya sp. FACHB-711]|uniref:hypothetical protein n=1 Tax=Leptolyngbya sp. FACHB-711 TaxID=2692813 RepID=UPI001688244F|nr:hypothetical protein [Leptolyngbya sp. FACHB-711]MBD1853952.1 hypothetical protein [Cyanobacteria bacterium FACHB-502]MBD2025244.1 hypothetical protein [Leptolyngbya sp. FACHB-711]
MNVNIVSIRLVPLEAGALKHLNSSVPSLQKRLPELKLKFSVILSQPDRYVEQ